MSHQQLAKAFVRDYKTTDQKDNNGTEAAPHRNREKRVSRKLLLRSSDAYISSRIVRLMQTTQESPENSKEKWPSHGLEY